MIKHNPKLIAAPAGPYTHAIEVGPNSRCLHIAGQVGMKPDGKMAEGFEAQAQLGWENLLAVLASADMTVDNLVKLTHYLLEPSQVAPYRTIRERFLGKARPASTLLIVKALVSPDWLFEIDGVAVA